MVNINLENEQQVKHYAFEILKLKAAKILHFKKGNKLANTDVSYSTVV